MNIYFEPILQWPHTPTPARERRRAPFKAAWASTIDLVTRELRQVGAESVAVQSFHGRHERRVDGWPRADREASNPGVIVSFEANGQPLSFPCDTFDKWVDNLRAIGLALEALRKIDRYGVTHNKNQYAGWLALPAPTLTIEQEIPDAAAARAWLKKRVFNYASGDMTEAEACRRAMMLTHPDKGGDPDDFKRAKRCDDILRGAA